MGYLVYTAEFKMAMVKEFLTSSYSAYGFAKEKNIKYTTFRSWLALYRKSNDQLLDIKDDNRNMLKPIDVTREAKAIIKKETSHPTERIKLELEGMKLTFPISCLKEVLEVIRNG